MEEKSNNVKLLAGQFPTIQFNTDNVALINVAFHLWNKTYLFFDFTSFDVLPESPNLKPFAKKKVLQWRHTILGFVPTFETPQPV